MNAPDALPTDAPSLPAAGRDRLRLFALLGMVLVWMLPDWVQVDVGGVARFEKGAVRTGVTGARSLIALWGLASSSLAARSFRGLRLFFGGFQKSTAGGAPSSDFLNSVAWCSSLEHLTAEWTVTTTDLGTAQVQW